MKNYIKPASILSCSTTTKTLCRLTYLTTGISILMNSLLAHADDTAVYLRATSLPPEQTRSNVVLVLDTSGSMGLPLSSSYTKYKEFDDFDSNDAAHATGKANYSGGAGEQDYVYFYNHEWNSNNWVRNNASPWVFVNKVHKDQVSCDLPGLNGSTPYTTSTDRFLFGDPATIDASNPDGDFQPICAHNDSTCSLTAASSGPKVDCRSQNKHVNDDDDFPSSTYFNNMYMVGWKFHNYLQSRYRYSTLQYVVKDLIDDGFDVNLAMMNFNGSSGGEVFKEAYLASDSSLHDNVKTTVTTLDFAGSTPLAETLWEASRYLRGEHDDWGSGSTSAAFVGGSNSNVYDTPIDYACQKSHIVILSDGEPTSDTDGDTDIENRIGTACSGNCLDDYAKWLYSDNGGGTYSGYTRGSDPDYRRDHIPTATLTEDQTIEVYTVAFAGLDSTLLQSTATNAGGVENYYKAQDADQLATVFDNLFSLVEFEADATVAPAVAVNAYSGLQHREELYFALFKPAATPRWNGNLKKYKLVDGEIVDVNDNLAIDSDTGFFNASSTSYWTTARDVDGDGNTDFSFDGSDITIGGIATELTTPTSRKMYTYTGASPVFSVTAPTPVTLSSENLDLNSSNSITNNTAINTTPTLLGTSVTSSVYAQEVIDWARGGIADATAVGTANPNPPNYFFPDVMHNPPVVITYDTNTTSTGCTDDDPCFTDVLFAGTNLGTFHAIDTDTGAELWSFVPKELLPNLTTYYERVGGFTDKVYGLDGTIQVWRNDVNSDGTINGSDHVYIYQPMRRGGTDIYAFDITQKLNPKLMWQIEGTGLDTTPSGDYQDLAQTWSSLQRTAINWGGTKREVLFFGGGYDPIHDTPNTTPVSNGKGNAIYMVDATTSELLWSAGNGIHHDFNNSKLNYSFAADIFTADVDGDDFVDFIYAVDITGNVWRFDFDNNSTTAIFANGVKGGLVAELGGNGTTDFRRFYNAPDVAFFSPRGTTPFLTISIASGHRADPREEDLDDHLYVFFDSYTTSHPSNYNFDNGTSTITATELGNAGTPNALGWKLALTDTGEKGLSQSVTFDGSILFTTYIPDSTATCVGSTGSGRFYVLNALTGDTTLPNDDTSDPTDTLPYQDLIHGGIPPEPSLIYGTGDVCVKNCNDPDSNNHTMSETTKITTCIGTECIDYVAPFEGQRAYWRQN